MREGSLEAPIRHPLDWQNPEFYDEAKLDELKGKWGKIFVFEFFLNYMLLIALNHL
jgi:hypothetical protein